MYFDRLDMEESWLLDDISYFQMLDVNLFTEDPKRGPFQPLPNP
jgi:hypothetical protein